MRNASHLLRVQPTMMRIALALAILALLPSPAISQTKKPPVKKPVIKKKAPVKKKAPSKKAPVVKKKVDPLNAQMVGTWFLLDSEGKPVTSTKITFTAYSEFTFIGSAWKSGGTFTLRDGWVNLAWTSVDGAAVKAGTMKKKLPLEADGTRLQLDRFRYGKTGT